MPTATQGLVSIEWTSVTGYSPRLAFQHDVLRPQLIGWVRHSDGHVGSVRLALSAEGWHRLTWPVRMDPTTGLMDPDRHVVWGPDTWRILDRSLTEILLVFQAKGVKQPKVGQYPVIILITNSHAGR